MMRAKNLHRKEPSSANLQVLVARVRPAKKALQADLSTAFSKKTDLAPDFVVRLLIFDT
jgi:hypothetical protein